MKAISPENQLALNQRQLVARDFLWFVARNRSTGNPVTAGFWSDIENVDVFVINPETLTPTSRTYYGASGLISISDIPSVSVLQVQDIQIAMSQLDEYVQQIVRDYDVRQAKVEIHRGLFDPDSRNLVSPAMIRFVGYVNNIEITTPSENNEGGVVITCVSHTQEMIRSNPSTRSDEDQRLSRSSTDNFFADAAVVGNWDIEWGAIKGSQKVETTSPKGLFGWGNFLGFL